MCGVSRSEAVGLQMLPSAGLQGVIQDYLFLAGFEIEFLATQVVLESLIRITGEYNIQLGFLPVNHFQTTGLKLYLTSL